MGRNKYRDTGRGQEMINKRFSAFSDYIVYIRWMNAVKINLAAIFYPQNVYEPVFKTKGYRDRLIENK